MDLQRAQNTLSANARMLIELGDLLQDKRNELILKEAVRYDVEHAAREEIFSGAVTVQASKVREYIKWKMLPSEKDAELAKMELRGLIEKKEILIETNNSLKAALRMAEMEAKLLNAGT